MSKIAVIAVPYIISVDLHYLMQQTIESLLSCKRDHELDLIAIINGHNQDPQSLNWIKKTFNHSEFNDQNILARAWNKGIKLGLERGADYCLVINLDLLFHPLYLNNLVSFAQNNPQAVIWTGCHWPEQTTLLSADLNAEPNYHMLYSAFMLDKRLFELAGEFDEQFKPAYHEDSDMAYRLSLLKLQTLSTSSAAFYHFENATIQTSLVNKDISSMTEIKKGLYNSMELYKKKWGGLPGEERFKTPYEVE